LRISEPASVLFSATLDICTFVEKGGTGNVYVRFYCGFYSIDVAVALLNHFLTVGRHGVNVCRTNITIKSFLLPPLFY
jgi:hypothetical protein